MNNAEKYIEKIKELNSMNEAGLENSDEANSLLDEMDEIWYSLTEEEESEVIKSFLKT